MPEQEFLFKKDQIKGKKEHPEKVKFPKGTYRPTQEDIDFLNEQEESFSKKDTDKIHPLGKFSKNFGELAKELEEKDKKKEK